MGREKVRPEDRQRSSRACLPCKASKIRCDAQSPCTGCVRRGRITACLYVDSSSRDSAGSTPHSSKRSQDPSQTPNNARNVRPRRDQAHEEAPSQLASPFPSRSSGHSPVSPQLTSSRLLLSSKGEKVYVGEMASLAFLHFLRQTLRQNMGPSAFTEGNNGHMMLEVDMNHDRNDHFDDASNEEKKALVQCCFDSTSAVLDLYAKDEIFHFLSESRAPMNGVIFAKTRRHDLAVLNLYIAIGAQCRGSPPSDLRYAAKYFAQAQQIAFEGMLNDPTLGMIRHFLLMAFYMLGACRRNAAFMYLGVAAKAAAALGLHGTAEDKSLPTNEQIIRKRVWKSLCILDLIVSSILGRSSSVPSIGSQKDISNETLEEVNAYRGSASNAVFEVCSLIDDITQKPWKGRIAEPVSAEQYLQRLRSWSQALASGLKQFTRSYRGAGNPADREALIGNTHIACVYYFAVILVTRPFMISHLMWQFPDKARDNQYPALDMEGHQRNSDLAQVCVDSATCMAQICHKAMESGLLLNNMCLLKAWIFAAGLVLGFSLSTPNEAKAETENAFMGARLVLKKLSNSSPQAKQYYDILTSFSEAINIYRQQLMSEKSRKTNQYVDHTFMIDLTSDGSQPYGETSSANIPESRIDLGSHFDHEDPVSISQLDSSIMDLPFLGGDFPIEYDPLGMFFENLG